MKYLGLLIFTLKGLLALAQPNQVKFVACNGGDITKIGIYTVHSVVGEMVVGEFSNGSYSGSIGFLDTEDSLALSLNPITQTSQQFKIYPNPASGDIWIDFLQGYSGGVTITITNSIGVSLYSKEYLDLSSGQILLGKEIFPTSGIYIVSINSDTGVITDKLIITR